jgi:hypothetical protein
MISQIFTLLVGPMFWSPFNQLSGLIPTETTTVTTAVINEGNAKALPLKNPGGPSLKHSIASRLKAVHLIADQVSSCPVCALYFMKSS